MRYIILHRLEVLAIAFFALFLFTVFSNRILGVDKVLQELPAIKIVVYKVLHYVVGGVMAILIAWLFSY